MAKEIVDLDVVAAFDTETREVELWCRRPTRKPFESGRMRGDRAGIDELDINNLKADIEDLFSQ